MKSTSLTADQTCMNCRFWSVFPIDADATFPRGTCRRLPPVIDALAVHEETHFFKENGKDAPEEASVCPSFWRQPTTWADQWCGEHQPDKGQLT